MVETSSHSRWYRTHIIMYNYTCSIIMLSLNMTEKNRCTGEIGTPDCQRHAKGPYILPPVLSGSMDTRNSFAFLYGKVQIRAKLPQGDWIYPGNYIKKLAFFTPHGHEVYWNIYVFMYQQYMSNIFTIYVHVLIIYKHYTTCTRNIY